MTRDDIIRMAREANFYESEIGGNEDGFVHFAALVTAAEREDVLNTIDALYDGEQGRHPMFSEGYNHALLHIEEFVKGRT